MTVTPPFTLATLGKVRFMAKAGRAAYPGEDRAALLPGLPVTPVTNGEFSAIVAFDQASRTTTIAVTGTDQPKNFLTDGECDVVCHPRDASGKMRLHAGFRRGCVALWPLLEPYIVSAQYLRLGGHSLGAAITRQILLEMALQHMPMPEFVGTIGEPRGLNSYAAAFLEDMGVESWRVINRYDVVPRVPLLSLATLRPLRVPGLFTHVQGSLWIDPYGKPEVNKFDLDRLPEDIRGFWREVRAKRGDVLVGDHSASYYTSSLDSLALPEGKAI